MAARAILFDYFGVLAHRYGACNEELMAFIEKELVGKYRLGVLSNMNDGSEEAMLRGYASLFDAVVLSGSIGAAKPDGRAYLEAARQLGEFASDCVMIDDSEVNCIGAHDAGMEAILFTNLADLEQNLAKYGILTP